MPVRFSSSTSKAFLDPLRPNHTYCLFVPRFASSSEDDSLFFFSNRTYWLFAPRCPLPFQSARSTQLAMIFRHPLSCLHPSNVYQMERTVCLYLAFLIILHSIRQVYRIEHIVSGLACSQTKRRRAFQTELTACWRLSFLHRCRPRVRRIERTALEHASSPLFRFIFTLAKSYALLRGPLLLIIRSIYALTKSDLLLWGSLLILLVIIISSFCPLSKPHILLPTTFSVPSATTLRLPNRTDCLGPLLSDVFALPKSDVLLRSSFFCVFFICSVTALSESNVQFRSTFLKLLFGVIFALVKSTYWFDAILSSSAPTSSDFPKQTCCFGARFSSSGASSRFPNLTYQI